MSGRHNNIDKDNMQGHSRGILSPRHHALAAIGTKSSAMPIVDFPMTAVPYQVHITLHPLTHCGLVTQSSDISSWILVNIGLGNGLLPDGTKPLPEPVLINHQWERLAFTWGQFHSNDIYLWHDLENNSFKITATMG